jgi:hypothetical protein
LRRGGWSGSRGCGADDADDTWDQLGAIAQLLHQAANQVWDQASQVSPDSPLHSLGLGVYLAQAQAGALLPENYVLPDVNVEGRTSLQLLTEAEELTRRLPVQRPVVNGSHLVIDLGDLIREARDLGC